MGPRQGRHIPAGVSTDALLWGEGPQRGLGPEKAEKLCCVVKRRLEKKVRGRGGPKARPQGRLTSKVGRREQGVGHRVRERTKRNLPNMVVPRSLVSLDAAVPIFKV